MAKGMGIERAFNGFHRWVATWPSTMLTIVLIVLGLLIISIAIHGTTTEKVVTAGWVIFP